MNLTLKQLAAWHGEQADYFDRNIEAGEQGEFHRTAAKLLCPASTNQLLYRLRADIESGGASEAMKETLRECLVALERPNEIFSSYEKARAKSAVNDHLRRIDLHRYILQHHMHRHWNYSVETTMTSALTLAVEALKPFDRAAVYENETAVSVTLSREEHRAIVVARAAITAEQSMTGGLDATRKRLEPWADLIRENAALTTQVAHFQTEYQDSVSRTEAIENVEKLKIENAALKKEVAKLRKAIRNITMPVQE